VPPDLIPIPLRGDLAPVSGDDPKALREALNGLIKDYNRLYGILRQDVNRLATPGPDSIGELRKEVHEIGRLLAAVTTGILGETLVGLEDHPGQFNLGDTRRIVAKYRKTVV